MNIPQPSGPAPVKSFEELLTEWQEIDRKRAEIVKEEARLRRALVAAAFPDPKEGVNKLELVDGRILKATHRINRSVDEAALDAVREKLAKLSNEITFEDLFKQKHSLQVGPYKKLTDDKVIKAVNMAIVSKPGTPSIEVV